MKIRDRLEAAMAKPMPPDKDYFGDSDYFDPWEDVVQGIYGGYASQSDALMIEALRAVQGRTHSEFMEKWGFAGEFALYILAGHGMTEYGTSPRFAWPDPSIEDLWLPLVQRWGAWYELSWGEPHESSEGSGK